MMRPVFIIAEGISYGVFNKKVQTKGEVLFNKDKTGFIQYGHERMEKVLKSFLIYQLVFAAFVVVSLIIILFIKAPVLKEISFALAILFIRLLIIEGFSHPSIVKYNNKPRQEVQK